MASAGRKGQSQAARIQVRNLDPAEDDEREPDHVGNDGVEVLAYLGWGVMGGES